MATALALPAAAPQGRIRRDEWIRLGGMFGAILALHVAGFGILLLVARHHYHLGSQGVFGVGLGITAYTLGMRHAFDADHLAAIDNTTRKLLHEKRRPLSVGFWFSLGHSSVVFGLCVLLGLGVRSIAGSVSNDNSRLEHDTGLIGTSVSGTFLLLIAMINLFVLIGITKMWIAMRRGVYDEETLEGHLNNRGLINRILRRVTGAITRPWQMYPVGLLFGLGFDTATEVALLVLAGGAAAFALPWYAILCLPILFTAGMALFDTIDGTFMNFAYGWAFSNPVRKIYYNLTITALSVAVAVLIGGIELMGLLTQQAGLHGGLWDWIGGLDLNKVGYGIVALFVVTWGVAAAYWKLGRVEERWSAGLRGGAAAVEE